MNLIAVVIGVLTIVLLTLRTIPAIQVPTAWPKVEKKQILLHQNRNQIRPLNIIRPASSEIFLNKQNHQFHLPYAAPARIPHQKYNKVNTMRSRPLERHPNLKKIEETPNEWTPIVPSYPILRQSDLPVKKLANLRQKPLSKFRRREYNYRDDRTHEEEPKSEGLEFPTRVNYPGEGQWAQKGKKHQVFIPIHRFAQIHREQDEEATKPEEVNTSKKNETTAQSHLEEGDEEATKPEGIELFEKNEKLFDKNLEKVFQPAKQHFREKLPLPSNHKSSEEAEEEPEEENESVEFVPMQLYSQVRRSENEEYLPSSAAEDERLKEIVKDSKIQTVYTEEGYEDAAYDHAGHEKLAEEDEGFAEFDKDVDERNGNHSGEETNEEDTASAGSEYKKLKNASSTTNPKKVNKNDRNNFIKTEETKTTAVKDAGGGTSEMEISSQIKILATPNNSSKTHKYLKIFPKIYRYDRVEPLAITEAPLEAQIQAETPSEEALTIPEGKKLGKRRKYKKIVQVEEVTAAPEGETSTRSIVAHIPELEFPAEVEETSSESENLVDSLNHVELAQVQEVTTEPSNETSSTPATQAQPGTNQEVDELAPLETISSITKAFYKIDQKRFKRSTKYPYYSSKGINPDSPLRYSEALETIPEKNHNEMAFYNQADAIECPEVETEIDPIPQHVKNGEEADESAERIVKGPRLGKLGDKIECFKVKYFGENPLDSPLFTEVTISPVVPVLNFGTTRKSDLKINEIPTEKELVEISTKPVQIEKEEEKMKVETSTIAEEIKGNRTESSITIITTPKYTIDLQPKHIYDQIELLHYLPGPSGLLQNASTSSEATNRTGKSLEEVAEATTAIEGSSPESAALRKRRRRIRPLVMNQFMTPPPRAHFPLFPFTTTTTTTTPKEELISEVYYKNEIKPIEQLNVFSDIINNIKNSTKESLSLANAAPSDRIAVKLNTFGNNNYYPLSNHRTKTIHMKNSEVSALDNIEETNSFYLSTTSRPTDNQIRSQFVTHKDNYEDLINQEGLDSIELLKTTENHPGRISTTHRYEKEEVGEVSEVLGMMPPGLDRYQTIYAPPEEVTLKAFVASQPALHPEKKMNNFFYIGMKPPSSKQKILLYSDFKLGLNPKRKFISRRGRRSAQRPVYSSVVRNRNKPIDAQDDEEDTKPIVVPEEEDDYVPHRPKNYHYDEKTGRIVYDKKEDSNSREPEEEVVYIEVTEAPAPKPTRRSGQKTKPEAVPAPKFAEATGPSFVEFVKKLKSDPKYESIPDPTTTEKPEEIISTSTAQANISTTPPEFLGILAKVRSNANYKPIEEKSTLSSITTTPEEEPEETQVENVQNSPGGQSTQVGDFQIFDISEYLPKVKSYSPRTSIDYSKYKTIERPSLRHNLSSRYSEEEDLENVRTSRVPILLKDEEMSESKLEEMVPEATTTTEVPSSTTSKRVRTRVRGTRRPVTTSAPLGEQQEEEEEAAKHQKPKRTYPRRRPGRIRISSKIPEDKPKEIQVEPSEKVVTRRQISAKIIQKRMDTPPSDELPKNSSNPIDPRRRRIVKKRTNRDEAQPSIQTLPKVIKRERVTPRRIDQVEVFNKNIDLARKHGGNYKEEEQPEEKGRTKPVAANKSETKQVKQIQRLTDVVPKPDKFYTDRKLPENVNKLKETSGDLNLEEGEEEVDEEGGPVRDEVLDYDENVEEELDEAYPEEKAPTSTKKPFFVKDPSTRLYYYAPV